MPCPGQMAGNDRDATTENPQILPCGARRREPAKGGPGPRRNGAAAGLPELALQDALLVARYQDLDKHDELVAAKYNNIFYDGGAEMLSREFLRMLDALPQDEPHSVHTNGLWLWEKTA